MQTRLQWLALLRDPAKPKPAVVQLLGTQDHLAAPDDAVDFAVDGMMNTDYLYIELPSTNHAEAKVFSSNSRDLDGQHAAYRKRMFAAALADDLTTLNERCITRAMLADTLPPKPDDSVEEVVFVVPGIRDDGYWARGIAQRIRQTAAKYNRPVNAYRSITWSHGSFGMLAFISPWIRREKVEWLMDAYVDAVSSYPRARFSYVGHSNGAGLVTRALRAYPAIRFRNVLFARSALRRDDCWDRLITAGRVSRVLTMGATADRFDPDGGGRGGVGHDGSPPAPSAVRFLAGEQGAGLMETELPRIAEFIVNDVVPRPSAPDHHGHRSSFRRSVRSPRVIVPMILLFVVTASYLLRDVIPAFAASSALLWTAATFAYALLVWLIVTRV